MRVQYLLNSGFFIELDSCNILIDYIGGEVLENEKKTYILASHSHGDHYSQKIWALNGENTIYILSKDIEGCPASENIFFIEKGESYQNEAFRVKAFGSTDIGVSFLIEAEGKKIFHAGDLNNWHWNEESEPEEVKSASDFFHAELKEISQQVEHVDFLFFPVDPRLGKDYMLGATEFLEKVSADYFIPMHFWGKFHEANAFKPVAEAAGAAFVKIEKDAPSGIIFDN